MRRKILAFIFAAALLVALAVPLFGRGTAQASEVGACEKAIAHLRFLASRQHPGASVEAALADLVALHESGQCPIITNP